MSNSSDVTDETRTFPPYISSPSTAEQTVSESLENTTKIEDNTTVFKFSTDFTDIDNSSLPTSHLTTPSEDASNTYSDLTTSDSNDILTSSFGLLSTSHTTEVTSKSSTVDSTLKYSTNDYDSKTITTLPTTSDESSVSISSNTDLTSEETKNYSVTHIDGIITETIPVSSITELNIFETTFETFDPSMDLISTSNPTTLETNAHEILSIVTDAIDEISSVSTTPPVPLVTTDKTFISTDYETASSNLTDITSVTNLTDEISTTESKLNTETELDVKTGTTSPLSNETSYSTDSSKSNTFDFSTESTAGVSVSSDDLVTEDSTSDYTDGQELKTGTTSPSNETSYSTDSSKSNTFDFSTESTTGVSFSSDDHVTEDLTSDYSQKMTSTSLIIETSENNVESTTIQKSSTNSEIQTDKISTLSTSILPIITDSDSSETPTVIPTKSTADTITPELTTIYSSTSKTQTSSQNTEYESTFVSTESSTLLSTETSSEFLDKTTERNNFTHFTLVTNQTDLDSLETTTILSTQFSTGMDRTTTKLPDETPTDYSSTITSESDYATSTTNQTQSSKTFTENTLIPTVDEATTIASTAESSYKTVLTTSTSDFKTSSERTIPFSSTTDSVFTKDTEPSQTTDFTTSDVKYTSDKNSDFSTSTTPINVTHETDSENLIFTTETSLSSSDMPTERTSSDTSPHNETFPTAGSSSYTITDLETSESTFITDGRTLSMSTSNETFESSTVSSGIHVTDDMSTTFSSTISEHSTTDINHETLSTTVSGKTDSDSSVSDQTEPITFMPTNQDSSTIARTYLTSVEDLTKYTSITGITSSHSTEIEIDKTPSDYSTITEHQTSTLPSETTTLNSICLTPHGFYPNPNDCHSFYECSNGIPKLSLCIENDHFNPNENRCEDPCTAKCDPNANCPTTESVLSSSQPHFTETGGSSLYTITSSEIPTKSTRNNDLTSVSDETSEVFSEPDVSSTDLTSASETSNSSDGTFTTSITDQNKYETTELSSVFTNTATSTKSSAAFTTGSYTSEDHSESTHTYPSSISEENTSPPSTLRDHETEPYSSTERTLVTDGLSSVSTNEPQTDITEEKSSRTDSSDSGEIITSPGLFTTDDLDGSSFDTDESIDDTSLQTSPTSITSSKCGNEGCSSTNVPVISTPIPFRVCHLNDFLSRINCNEYTDCTEKIPKKKECPLGLYFNPTTRVCDWPYKAGCGETGKPLYEPDDSFECPCKSCLIPSSKSCSHYYLCLGYTAYHLQCSNSLLFDKTLNTCNYSPLVDCLEPSSTTIVTRKPTTASTTKRTTTKRTTPRTTTTRTTTTRTTTTTTTSQPKRFVCPSREGLFRYPGNCGMFYQCSNWFPYAMHCAATTHFSEITKNCEYPCDAKCDLTLNCGKHTTAAPRDPRCTCRNCKLPSDETCTKYIVCVNGKARMENCPWGQTYDFRRATCDWAHRVDCHHSEVCPERNGLFAHKEDCHKFVHCSNGIPYVKTCPDTLEFDSNKRRCEWPAGRCSQSSIPKQFEIFQTPEKRGGWRCPKSFGYFADDDQCNKFYHCSYGTPSLKECSEGLLYNPRYQNCDWKKHVRCQSNRHYSPKKCRVYDNNATCSSDRKPLPHNHCNMYYDCTAGRACAKQCPTGLFFNRTTGICDFPSNVKCFHPTKNDYSLRDFSQKCSSHDHGHMSSPTDAACFYRCRRGIVIPGCCSRGHVYNQNRDRCERITKSYRL